MIPEVNDGVQVTEDASTDGSCRVQWGRGPQVKRSLCLFLFTFCFLGFFWADLRD